MQQFYSLYTQFNIEIFYVSTSIPALPSPFFPKSERNAGIEVVYIKETNKSDEFIYIYFEFEKSTMMKKEFFFIFLLLGNCLCQCDKVPIFLFKLSVNFMAKRFCHHSNGLIIVFVRLLLTQQSIRKPAKMIQKIAIMLSIKQPNRQP